MRVKLVVVITGFSIAGFLINQSFQSWAEQPIVTTIETLPAEDMKLPKVTVCPPKNSFTDLNYDLMLARNVTFTTEMKDELYDYAESAIDSGYLKYLSKLQDKDHFHNWYNGISPMELPILYKDRKTAPHPRIHYTLTSYALSGNIITENFGEKVSSDLLERNVEYLVEIRVPEEFQKNGNKTIDLKFEWLHNGKGRVRMSIDNMGFYQDQGFRNYSIAIAATHTSVIYVHYKHTIEIGEDFQMDHNPGFKLSWTYSGIGLESAPKPVTFGSGNLTDSFRRRVTKITKFYKKPFKILKF